MTGGADAVEPDLLMTRDGVVVVRHESELSRTTDVAHRAELAAYRTTKLIDGVEVTGWFVEDLTLAELKTLRAGHEQVLTFDELLLMVSAGSQRLQRSIGVYAELKDATRLARLGLDLEDAVLATLADHGVRSRTANIHLQSFEPSCLRRLRDRSDLRLVQLVGAAGRPADLSEAGDPTTYDDLVSAPGLRNVSRYADAVGLAKSRLLGDVSEAAALVDRAHLHGLEVLAWTVRDTSEVLPLLNAGVDGMFCDDPAAAVSAREAWLTTRVG